MISSIPESPFSRPSLSEYHAASSSSFNSFGPDAALWLEECTPIKTVDELLISLKPSDNSSVNKINDQQLEPLCFSDCSDTGKLRAILSEPIMQDAILDCSCFDNSNDDENRDQEDPSPSFDEGRWISEFREIMNDIPMLSLQNSDSSNVQVPPMKQQPEQVVSCPNEQRQTKTKKLVPVKPPRTNAVKHLSPTQRPKRIYKKRRIIPENKEFISESTPCENDVVGGRGGVSTHHEGNKRYWLEVLRRREEYRTCGDSNRDKTKIASSIVELIKSNGGRFVDKDKETKRYFILPDKVSLDKVKQALRDEYVPVWARKPQLHS